MPTQQQLRLLLNGRTFVPSDVSGLALWLKADTLVLADGAAVSSWADQSGNGRNAAQATGTKQPLYKVNIINGKPVLRFDSTDDCLTIPAVDFSSTAGLSLFVVTATIPSATDRIIFETSANSSTSDGAILLYRQTDNKVQANLHGSGVNNNTFITTATITSAATVISAVYDRALSTNETTAWLNGATAGTRPNNADTTGNHGNFAINIGARNNGASVPFGGDIAEIILYNSALSAVNRLFVERYLGAKYGITVA